MKKNKTFEKFLEYLVSSSLFLFIFITLMIIIPSIIFILGGKLFKYLLLVIYIISVLGFLTYSKKNIKKGIISIVIATIAFSFFTFVSSYIYDNTADGNTYHKLAVGAMKNGWNPVWTDISKFNKEKGNPFNILEDNVNVKWVNTYAKGSEIYGAVVYSFTGNIDSGKSFNMVFVFIALFIIYSILRKLKLNVWKALLTSSIMALNPISLTQLTNYYLDGVLAICLFMIIIIIMNKELLKENINYIILGLAIIWCCSVKFTGIAFAGVFCGIFYLYNNFYLYRKNKEEFKMFIIKDTIFYLTVVLISVLVVGSSSYAKNFLEHGHPFYPLYGKGHVDNMVLMEMPKSMQKDSNTVIFIKGIFSKSENSSPSYSSYNNQPDWKIPFTIGSQELKNFVSPDLRIGGFGYFFGGVFLLSIIGTVIYLIEFKKKKDYNEIAKNIIFLGITTILVLVLDGSYWARYIPYVFMFPVLVIINFYKLDLNKKIITLFSLIISLFLILDSLLIFGVQLYYSYKTNSYLRRNIAEFRYYTKEKEIVEVQLDHHGIQGIEYNLDDLNISNYKLVDEEKQNIGYGFKY